jgi:membrane-bound ClpP family serine protease
VDLDASTLAAGFLVSGVGFVLFSYGRKMSRFPHIIVGLVLMVFPYFVPGVLLMFGIAALLCGLLYLATRAGY